MKQPFCRNFRRVLSVAAMLGLAAASYAGDETASASTNQNEVQQLKQQLADQQKQIEELRLILLGQKKEIDKVANAAAAPAEQPQATLPAIGRGTGEIASSTPQLPASTAVIPVAFTPAV